MAKLTTSYELDTIKLARFPSEVTLKHGEDGEREWWEWWGNAKRPSKGIGIVIQKPNHALPYIIMFFDSNITRSLDLPLTEQDRKRRIIAKTFGACQIEQAIQALADLGIQAGMEDDCDCPVRKVVIGANNNKVSHFDELEMERRLGN